MLKNDFMTNFNALFINMLNYNLW